MSLRSLPKGSLALAIALVSGAAVEVHAAPARETKRAEPAPIATTVQAPATPTTDGHLSPALALAALDRRIADLDAEEQISKGELGSLGAKIAEAHTRSLTRGRAFYRLTRAGMLPVGGGFSELVSHALRVERSRRALAADLENEQKLRQRGAELSRALERVARDRIALSSQRTAMDAARVAMDDEARRQSAFDRAFAGDNGPSDFVAVNAGPGAPSDRGQGFASSRGRLLFPLAGRSEVRPTRREGTDGPGLEIKTALGASVRAVFAGRVAFADRYGPYGRLVILDHGDHYYTVSGNLAGIDVKVGDEVSAGERIGTVGDEGKGPTLYFEIRHGTETLAPSPWLGV
ncbi:Membrane protein related to metalloendopeptidase [Labilithrix luteola]|uniref:Membrane protein related to metalloendopeptidase n=1 Tax=Labilithrix luteola TaxID=1391654 RepID=A0A0K1PSF2_9BACT|nr:peptidoglycan DD-metalloendopeptidase family protein [Labilithrix luteola]AKU96470.1 Membrane protein related to metalloendopeptidase [Labilithrix luteola]